MKERFFDYPEQLGEPDVPPLSRWLAQRYAEGWAWAGDPPRRLVVDGVPVQRYRFVADSAGRARPPRPRDAG